MSRRRHFFLPWGSELRSNGTVDFGLELLEQAHRHFLGFGCFKCRDLDVCPEAVTSIDPEVDIPWSPFDFDINAELDSGG